MTIATTSMVHKLRTMDTLYSKLTLAEKQKRQRQARRYAGQVLNLWDSIEGDPGIAAESQAMHAQKILERVEA